MAFDIWAYNSYIQNVYVYIDIQSVCVYRHIYGRDVSGFNLYFFLKILLTAKSSDQH